MGAPNSTMLLTQVVDPSLKKIFDESKNQLTTKSQYTQFPFTEYQIETTADKMSSLSGYGAGGLTLEGQIYTTDAKVQGYSKTLVTRKYTKRVPYTEELDYFLEKRSNMGVIEAGNMMKGLSQGLLLNWEQDFAKMFYLGQGTTFITGGDGLSLINANHTSGKAGAANQSNLVTVGATTNVVLNATSLQAAAIQLDRFRDNADTLMNPGTNKALICSRQLLENAFRLKVSEYGPDSANLGFGVVSPTITAATGYSIKVMPLHHMPDAYSAYWFLVDLDRMKEMVVLAHAWKPRILERMMDIDGVHNILASTLFGPNPLDWRWIAGSTGANPTP